MSLGRPPESMDAAAAAAAAAAADAAPHAVAADAAAVAAGAVGGPDAPGVLSTRWAGRDVALHPEGALVDVTTGTAFVADTHFGKPASFRRRGVPVPDGGAARDLERLDAVLDRSGAGRLVILGDFLHDAEARSPGTLAALASWRARRPELAVVLVRGNHDARAGDPPAELGIEVVAEPWDAAGIVCRHHPPEPGPGRPSTGDEVAGPAEAPVLAGHLHPVVVLRARRRGAGRERCRCFHVTSRGLVMPSFGSFTGGMPVRPRTGDRVFVLGPGVVLAAATA